MTVSKRITSKGSSRGAGPQKNVGTVNVRESSGIDWSKERRPFCACGRRMEQCPSCLEFWCVAPGHLEHVCNGSAEGPR